MSLLIPFASALRMPYTGSVREWVEENVVLPAGNGFVPSGKFKTSISPWMVEPLEALGPRSRYRVVNCVKPTQGAGTLIMDVVVPFWVVNAPGPIQWNWQAQPAAKEHAEDKAIPVIEHCEPANSIVIQTAKPAANIRRFANGASLIIQGGSEKRLQSKTVRYQGNDECWQWDEGMMREADSRLDPYYRAGLSKQFNVSQGGCTNTEWHRRATSGEWYDFMISCERCDHRHFPKMEDEADGRKVYLLKWETHKDSPLEPYDVHYICPNCGHRTDWSEAAQAKWKASSAYVNTGQSSHSPIVTYRWPGLLVNHWPNVARMYIQAVKAKNDGSTFLLERFIQKVVPDFWSESDIASMSPVEIATQDYNPEDFRQAGGVPDEAFRFMTVDVQRDLALFYVVVRAWCKDGTSLRLWRGRASSFDAVRKIQLDWSVRSQFVAVDCAYKSADVYRECCKYIEANGRGWVAFRGDDAKFYTHVDPDPNTKGKFLKTQRLYSKRLFGDPLIGMKNAQLEAWLASSPHALAKYRANKSAFRCPIYTWANDPIKDIFCALRNGSGRPFLAPYCEVRQPEEREYKKQIHGEVKKTKVDARGKEVASYYKVGQNHYFDCECMQVVCAVMASLILPPESNQEQKEE